MENWSLIVTMCNFPPWAPPTLPYSPPFISLLFIQVDELEGLQKCPKDQPSTPEAEEITSPTDRQCLANSTRLDHILLCVCHDTSAFLKETEEELLLKSPQVSKESIFTSGLLSHAVFDSSASCPNLDQRLTRCIVKVLNIVGWRTTLILFSVLKSRVLFVCVWTP